MYKQNKKTKGSESYNNTIDYLESTSGSKFKITQRYDYQEDSTDDEVKITGPFQTYRLIVETEVNHLKDETWLSDEGFRNLTAKWLAGTKAAKPKIDTEKTSQNGPQKTSQKKCPDSERTVTFADNLETSNDRTDKLYPPAMNILLPVVAKEKNVEKQPTKADENIEMLRHFFDNRETKRNIKKKLPNFRNCPWCQEFCENKRKCEKYINMTVENRQIKVAIWQSLHKEVCLNCFDINTHKTLQCKRDSCAIKGCTQKHHIGLHPRLNLDMSISTSEESPQEAGDFNIPLMSQEDMWNSPFKYHMDENYRPIHRKNNIGECPWTFGGHECEPATCQRWKRMSFKERWQMANYWTERWNGGCLRCFTTWKHATQDCKQGKCTIPSCNKIHHIALHDYEAPVFHYDVRGDQQIKYTVNESPAEDVLVEYYTEETKGYMENCPWCGEHHQFMCCDKVNNFNIDERFAIVNKRENFKNCVCKSCLGIGHNEKQCSYQELCTIKDCKEYHHPLFHDPPREPWQYNRK